jgi:hypothetical protein
MFFDDLSQMIPISGKIGGSRSITTTPSIRIIGRTESRTLEIFGGKMGHGRQEAGYFKV